MANSPHILITRPTGQQKQFARDCQALGFRVSHLPCLAIEGLQNPSLNTERVSKACRILFTSSNAVRYADALLPLPWRESAVQAIGPATARALVEKGQILASEPAKPYNSEAFLLQADTLAPQRLIIIKGVGGRTLIGDTLEKLGWQVEHIDVYKRLLPQLSPSRIDEILQPATPDVISVASNETLTNLMTLSGKHRSEILRAQLLVNSERCASLACDIGFRRTAIVAQPAGDQGQLASLKQWLNNQR
ncbi:MAG: uroporphyrinogen-III synthase [Granulosicoccus sp.]